MLLLLSLVIHNAVNYSQYVIHRAKYPRSTWNDLI